MKYEDFIASKADLQNGKLTALPDDQSKPSTT